MAKLSDDQYNEIVAKLTAKGFTPTTVYPALEKAGFKVKLNGKAYSVYASRVIALMHEGGESSDALEL